MRSCLAITPEIFIDNKKKDCLNLMTGITCVETVSVSPSLPLNTNPPPPI